MDAHSLEGRIDHIEEIFVQVNATLDRMDRKLDGFDRRFEGIDRRFDGLDGRLDSFESSVALRFDRVDRQLNWLNGITIAAWATTILTILLRR